MALPLPKRTAKSQSFVWDQPTDESGQDTLNAMALALIKGPIHVNCPFDVPLYPSTSASQTAAQPEEPNAKAGLPTGSWRPSHPSPPWFLKRLEQAVSAGEKVLLLGGTQPMPLSAEALQTWSRFAVIAGDTTSGLFSPDVPAISACDRWLSARENSGQPLQHMAPDVVITFGAPLVSRRLREALAALDFEHFHVEVSGGAPAAFSRAPQPVPCDISEAIEAGAAAIQPHLHPERRPVPCDISEAIEAGAAAIQPHLHPERNPELDAWQRNWWDQEAALRKAHNTAVDAAPWSDLRAHRCLHRAAPEGWDLHMANSTPVRYGQLFESHHVAQPMV